MPAPMTRANAVAHPLTLSESVRREIEALAESGELERTEPRCYVCCEVESKDLVNRLLAAGLTNREITDACRAINQRRQAAGDDRIIQPRNVWYHRKQHFNLDEPAQAVYREIAERRAAEANIDYVNGVGHMVTSYGVLETVMVKGLGRVTDENTEVSVKETIDSAVKLHELVNKDAGTRKMADLLYTMDRIIAAAQEFVPPDKHEAFLARVEGREAKPLETLNDRIHRQAIREFTPSTTVDEDDEL